MVQGLDPTHPEAKLATKLASFIYCHRTGAKLAPAAIRSLFEEDCRGPGKFEWEAPFVPYFYELALHGYGGEVTCHCSECCCDDSTCAACCAEEYGCECDSHWETFAVDDEARAIFPELAGVERVTLFYRSDGFVCEVS